MTARFVIATANTGKLREIAAVMGEYACELVPQAALGIEPAAETGPSFLENALIKARHAAAASGFAAIADDSGIAVEALGGRPGIRSARYAGPGAADRANVARLLEELSGAPASGRGAVYHCAMVLVRHAEDPMPLVSEGDWLGQIAGAPRGEGGFGYDPIFWLPERGRTAAELTPAEKNALSHRGQALRGLVERMAGAGLIQRRRG